MKPVPHQQDQRSDDPSPSADPAWTPRKLRELSEALPVGKGQRVNNEDAPYVQDCRKLLKRRHTGFRGWISWIILLVIAALIWWASWADMEEVTRGIGKVIPSKSVQLIQSLEGGIVQEILVEEGHQVEKGQPLLRIQDAIFSSSYEEKLSTHDELIVRIARHRAEVEGVSELVFPDGIREDLVEMEKKLFENRKADHEATREALEKRLALATAEQGLLESGRQTKAVSPIELIRAQKEAADLEGQLRTLRTKFKREAMEQWDQNAAELIALEQAILRDKDRLDRTVITSPVRGTINKIHINTVGRVIASGVDIMEIVPLDDSLLVEANIRPGDVAFISPGLKATVKFTAYDFSVYGGLEGTVEQLSVDTITDDKGESFYQIKVRTTENTLGFDRHGKELKIMPGMVTEVDIMTGRKTVLTYLLNPVMRAKERALRER